MQFVKLLFKRDFKEAFSSVKQKKDLIGLISSLLLIAVVYGVFVFVFNGFVKMYIKTNFGNPLNSASRVKELFTVCFGLVFIVNVIVGVKKIYNVLMDAKDNDVLIYMPIDSGSIFIYKLLKVYLSQVVSTVFVITPISIIMDLNTSLVGGVWYYLLFLAIVVLLPMMSCAIATLFSIPCLGVVKKVSYKFILVLCLYVLVIGVGFLGYGYFLKMLSELIRSGNIKYVFDLKTVTTIGTVTKWLYPSVFFTNILLKHNILISVVSVLGFSFIAVFASYFIVKKVYVRIIQKQLEGNNKTYKNSAKLKSRGPMNTLLHKEFLVVLRTPTYAFQYFAMAITLPFMVYVCASLLESMLETLTFVDCNYALAIFVVSMLSILTNTFCTTNISRDGKMFAIMKTMPISIHKIIEAKLIFCGIVSFISVLASCLVLLATGFLNFVYFIITFVVGFLFSLVQIAYATRKDMKKPCFPSNNQEEITEGNSNMSTIIFTGLVTTIIAGGGAVLLSVIIGMKYNEIMASYISIGFVLVITIISFILSFIYLFRGVKEEYYASSI